MRTRPAREQVPIETLEITGNVFGLHIALDQLQRGSEAVSDHACCLQSMPALESSITFVWRRNVRSGTTRFAVTDAERFNQRYAEARLCEQVGRRYACNTAADHACFHIEIRRKWRIDRHRGRGAPPGMRFQSVGLLHRGTPRDQRLLADAPSDGTVTQRSDDGSITTVSRLFRGGQGCMTQAARCSETAHEVARSLGYTEHADRTPDAVADHRLRAMPRGYGMHPLSDLCRTAWR